MASEFGLGGFEDSLAQVGLMAQGAGGVGAQPDLFTGQPAYGGLPGAAAGAMYGGYGYQQVRRSRSRFGDGARPGLTRPRDSPPPCYGPQHGGHHGMPVNIPQNKVGWHAASPLGGVLSMGADGMASSAPGRMTHQATLRSVGSNPSLLSGRSPGSMSPSTTNHSKEASPGMADPTLDPIERIRKRRRESAQRSRARKSAYIRSLEIENKALREALQGLHIQIKEHALDLVETGKLGPLTVPKHTHELMLMQGNAVTTAAVIKGKVEASDMSVEQK